MGPPEAVGPRKKSGVSAPVCGPAAPSDVFPAYLRPLLAYLPKFASKYERQALIFSTLLIDEHVTVL